MDHPQIDLFQKAGVIPAAWFSGPSADAWEFGEQSNPLIPEGRAPELLCLFWSLLLHADWLHLLLNLAALGLFGRNVEARLGGWRTTLFFLSCGAVGTSVQVLSDPTSPLPIIGSSGAISGFLGAYLVWFPKHFFRINLGKRFKRELLAPVSFLLLFWILSQGIQAFSQWSGPNQVAHFAHVGGFACGAFLAYLHRESPSPHTFQVFSGGKKGV
jgi:membrane associated rhomboid family serine protease